MKKIFLTVLLMASIIFTFSACGEAEIPQETPSQASKPIESSASKTASTVSENAPLTSQQTPSSTQIDQARAKQIALSHAGIKAENAKALKIEFDRDDGIPSYEIEFRVGASEYEYDIHAQSGKILKAEKDDKNLLNASNAALKTESEAKQIALNHAGIKAENAKALKIEFDRDDGIPSYEIEFKSGGYEYDYDIHAETGKILKFEKEIDN